MGDTLTFVAATGAMTMALLLPGYTLLSGIEMPRALTTGVLVFCLCAFVMGEVVGLYRTNGWWDVGLHLLASAVLAIAGVAMALLATEGAPPRTALWILAILGVGFAALVGAFWEMFEFSIDWTFGTHAQRSGLPDTMGDIATNVVGATYGATAAVLRLSRGARLPLTGLLVEFCAANPIIYGAWPGVPFPARPRAHAAPRGTAGPKVEASS